MLLMIDNYDSFTYNLVQYFGELGADVVVHRNDEITLAEIEKLDPEFIVISPGPCTPKEAGISMDVVRTFGDGPAARRLPGTPVHRRRIRRRRGARATGHARQDVDDPPRRTAAYSQACRCLSKQPATIR